MGEQGFQLFWEYPVWPPFATFLGGLATSALLLFLASKWFPPFGQIIVRAAQTFWYPPQSKRKGSRKKKNSGPSYSWRRATSILLVFGAVFFAAGQYPFQSYLRPWLDSEARTPAANQDWLLCLWAEYNYAGAWTPEGAALLVRHMAQAERYSGLAEAVRQYKTPTEAPISVSPDDRGMYLARNPIGLWDIVNKVGSPYVEAVPEGTISFTMHYWFEDPETGEVTWPKNPKGCYANWEEAGLAIPIAADLPEHLEGLARGEFAISPKLKAELLEREVVVLP